MAGGDATLTNHGSFDVSGAYLKTYVDGLTLSGGTSGAAFFMVPNGIGNQIQLIQVDVV